MPPDRELKKRVTVIVTPGPDTRFDQGTCREVRGNRFPITGARGETKGHGVVVAAVLHESGRALALEVEIPAHLAANFETDAGVALGEPYPGR